MDFGHLFAGFPSQSQHLLTVRITNSFLRVSRKIYRKYVLLDRKQQYSKIISFGYQNLEPRCWDPHFEGIICPAIWSDQIFIYDQGDLLVDKNLLSSGLPVIPSYLENNKHPFVFLENIFGCNLVAEVVPWDVSIPTFDKVPLSVFQHFVSTWSSQIILLIPETCAYYSHLFTVD